MQAQLDKNRESYAREFDPSSSNARGHEFQRGRFARSQLLQSARLLPARPRLCRLVCCTAAGSPLEPDCIIRELTRGTPFDCISRELPCGTPRNCISRLVPSGSSLSRHCTLCAALDGEPGRLPRPSSRLRDFPATGRSRTRFTSTQLRS